MYQQRIATLTITFVFAESTRDERKSCVISLADELHIGGI